MGDMGMHRRGASRPSPARGDLAARYAAEKRRGPVRHHILTILYALVRILRALVRILRALVRILRAGDQILLVRPSRCPYVSSADARRCRKGSMATHGCTCMDLSFLR